MSPKREARRAAREAQWADQWQEPESGYRLCEFCGCHTNALVRACCQSGRDTDRSTFEAWAADVSQNGAELNMSGDAAKGE